MKIKVLLFDNDVELVTNSVLPFSIKVIKRSKVKIIGNFIVNSEICTKHTQDRNVISPLLACASRSLSSSYESTKCKYEHKYL